MTIANNEVKKEELIRELDLFCGTEAYHRYSLLFHTMFLTDGAKYLGEQGYFWLFDIIASLQVYSEIRDDRMLKRIQIWHLTVRENRTGEIRCDRDHGDTAHSLVIPYTDSILDSVKLYVQPLHLSPFDRNEKGRQVIHLPSEY